MELLRFMDLGREGRTDEGRDGRMDGRMKEGRDGWMGGRVCGWMD